MPEATFKVKSLSELAQAGQLKGKRVLIRADLNVPQDEAGNITEDTRIRASMPALQMCLDAGAAVMVMASVVRLLKKFRRRILMRCTAEMINTNLGSLTLSNLGKR